MGSRYFNGGRYDFKRRLWTRRNLYWYLLEKLRPRVFSMPSNNNHHNTPSLLSNIASANTIEANLFAGSSFITLHIISWLGWDYTPNNKRTHLLQLEICPQLRILTLVRRSEDLILLIWLDLRPIKKAFDSQTSRTHCPVEPVQLFWTLMRNSERREKRTR